MDRIAHRDVTHLNPPKFSDTLTLSHSRGGGQIRPQIEEVVANIFPWLHPCDIVI